MRAMVSTEPVASTHAARRRVAIIGCGAIADSWTSYAASRPDLEIVAFADPFETAAAALRDRHQLDGGLFRSAEEAIAATGADLVFNTTIPEAHHQVTLAALNNGCDVFTEKPLAVSMAEAREIANAADAAGHRVSVMQNRRYGRQIRDLRAALSAGAIGPPSLYAADFFMAPHFGGFREEMPSPLLADMAIHTFDQCRLLSGADAVWAECHEFNPAGSWYRGAAGAICTFGLSDGTMFSYRGCWAAEGFATSWQGAWRISGAAGTACWDGETPARTESPARDSQGFFRQQVAAEVPRTWDGLEGHEGCIAAMLDALGSGAPAETDIRNNVGSLGMMLACVESSRNGGTRVPLQGL